MKNTFKVIWSKRAFYNLSRVILYLQEHWTEKEIINFSQKLDHCISIIEKRPEAFSSAKNKPGLRRVVLTKHNTLYYRIDGKRIIVVNIFDTRQNPKKI